MYLKFDINLSHKWMQTKTTSKKDTKAKKKRSKTKTNNICHNHNRSLCQRTTTTYLLIPWRMFKVRRSVFASLYDIVALIGFSSDLSNAQKFDTWPA